MLSGADSHRPRAMHFAMRFGAIFPPALFFTPPHADSSLYAALYCVSMSGVANSKVVDVLEGKLSVFRVFHD